MLGVKWFIGSESHPSNMPRSLGDVAMTEALGSVLEAVLQSAPRRYRGSCKERRQTQKTVSFCNLGSYW